MYEFEKRADREANLPRGLAQLECKKFVGAGRCEVRAAGKEVVP